MRYAAPGAVAITVALTVVASVMRQIGWAGPVRALAVLPLALLWAAALALLIERAKPRTRLEPAHLAILGAASVLVAELIAFGAW